MPVKEYLLKINNQTYGKYSQFNQAYIVYTNINKLPNSSFSIEAVDNHGKVLFTHDNEDLKYMYQNTIL